MAREIGLWETSKKRLQPQSFLNRAEGRPGKEGRVNNQDRIQAAELERRDLERGTKPLFRF